MARPRKHIVVTASQIEEAFTNGRVTVPMLAGMAGVSVPTMRRHLAETFGDRMTSGETPVVQFLQLCLRQPEKNSLCVRVLLGNPAALAPPLFSFGLLTR